MRKGILGLRVYYAQGYFRAKGILGLRSSRNVSRARDILVLRLKGYRSVWITSAS